MSVPCPSGAHRQSILAYRDFNWATLFCQPCEVAWTVRASHPATRAVPVERSILLDGQILNGSVTVGSRKPLGVQYRAGDAAGDPRVLITPGKRRALRGGFLKKAVIVSSLVVGGSLLLAALQWPDDGARNRRRS